MPFSSSKATLAAATAATSALLLYMYTLSRRRTSRYRSSQWHNEEEKQFGRDTLPSVIEHFKDYSVSKTSTVKEANQRRTLSYYVKTRQAHEQSLVLGQPNFAKLFYQRKEEMKQILRYYKQGTKSHRTVIVMLDQMTQHIMEEARHNILAPLQYSHDFTTKGVWIPWEYFIPPSDMHVTVAIPWWWHTMLPPKENQELSQALANRFRQALVYYFHHPFQLELERIILLGGKTLVALWRTIGERVVMEDQHVIQDRHGTDLDPMVRLRREIVQCFTTEKEEIKRKPLTYHSHKRGLLEQEEIVKGLFRSMSVSNLNCASTNDANDAMNGPSDNVTNDDTFDDGCDGKLKQSPRTHSKANPKLMPSRPRSNSMPIHSARPPLERQPSIEFRTPGMGDGDGFIHTTLCRLPLDCLSSQDVELEPIHRLCREATAMYAGHRMIVHRFRFLETRGKGGDSNPCVEPIFDESMDAPTRVTVDATGQVSLVGSHHLPNANGNSRTMSTGGGMENGDTGKHPLFRVESRNATIGALPGRAPSHSPVSSLFDQPKDLEPFSMSPLALCETKKNESNRMSTLVV